MKKVALADVLWDAANQHLLLDVFSYDGCLYSCNAVASALDRGERFFEEGWRLFQKHPAAKFLKSLGCAVSSNNQLLEFDYGEPRQGVRYMWLLLAMHVAEDEEIMVEVEE